MKFNSVVAVFVALSALILSSTANASLLSDYNLILTGDYNYQGGEVEGRTFVGGNLNASGQSPTFAIRETTVVGEDTVTVVGDIVASNINLNAGSLSYGGDLSVTNINLNGGGSSVQSVNDVDQTELLYELAALELQLSNESDYYASLTSNGTWSGSEFVYDGDESVAVFYVAASEVFAQNTSISLDAGDADTVIINVSGTDIDVSGGVNLTSGFSVNEDDSNVGATNILWNFYEATSIDFNSLAVVGSVLAIDADVIGGAVFDGTLAAASYTGSREFHSYGFDYEIPTSDIPEPSSIALFAITLIGIARLRRKTSFKQ